jgi:predicted P-loop ATPase
MLVLEGKQGKKKSSALQALFGAQYYKDSFVDFHTKDGMAAISEVWCQEIPELDSLKRSGITAIKAFLTNRVDNYRPAYGREIIERPRRCVFAGTTNEDVWNQDATGGRRFWSIECARTLRIDALAKDRELLLAEARETYRCGQKWWVDEDDEEAVAVRETQAARLDEHPWSEPIQKYLAGISEHERNEGLSAFEILKNACGIETDRLTGRDGQLIGHIMRSLSWRQDKHQTTRQGGKAKRYRPERADQAESRRTEVDEF